MAEKQPPKTPPREYPLIPLKSMNNWKPDEDLQKAIDNALFVRKPVKCGPLSDQRQEKDV